MIKDAIKTAADGFDLTFDAAREAMDEIMRGDATPAQIAAFLTALRIKGETPVEIAACAAVMRARCAAVGDAGDVIDIVGTGGDESYSFNISTVTAFVVAAGGVPVAKHGNRSVSSKCGAADFLEALGAKIDLTAGLSAEVLKKAGMCFMFAPNHHASMKYAAPVRREIGMRTIFNILGPLSNPAFAPLMLLGVYDESLVEPLAQALLSLGVKRALVVHGDDGLDEISLGATTTACELDNGTLTRRTIDPRDYGFSFCARDALTGGDPAENAEIARAILGGEKGPKRDAVVLNAAAALYIAGKSPDIAGGVKLAEEIIDSGRAGEKMREFISATHSV
jgi:anthranilate phosphoribosyltransferase